METSNKIMMPSAQDEDSIYKLFMEKVCKKNEVWIDGEPLLININYEITDPNYKREKKVMSEVEGQYTEAPILEINNVDDFKKALFNFIQAYVNKDSMWTRPYERDWMNTALYAMTTIWTDATNQDFTNPVSFLNRYTDFLKQNQWEDLKEEQEDKSINGIKIWKQVAESYSERETPHNYYLFTKNEDGKKIYFPSVCYGIQDDKAYIYAIHKIYGKNQNEGDEFNKNIRNYIKGRGVEPLGIATLMSFIEESKKRGITKIIMPDNFIMQYITKNIKKEQEISNWFRYSTEERKEQERQEKEIELDNNHKGSLNNRLMTMFIISKYYSTGIKFLEIPGEVSDNLTVDINDFKIGREIKKQVDHRNKGKIEEER